MKRLVRKSENINVFDERNVKPIADDVESMDNMTKLDELSEADVRHERCPICKYNPLKNDNGFKICPRCESIFKMLDGTGYMVDKM